MAGAQCKLNKGLNASLHHTWPRKGGAQKHEDMFARGWQLSFPHQLISDWLWSVSKAIQVIQTLVLFSSNMKNRF